MAHCGVLFDWGDTLMRDLPGMSGPMCDWPRVEVVSGAAHLLKRLRGQGVPCHLATGARDSGVVQIRAALERAGLDQYIGQILCPHSLGVEKGSVPFYAACAAALELPAASLLMIGDSLARDVLPARAAGMAAIWLNPAATPAPAGVSAIAELGEVPASPAFRCWCQRQQRVQ